MKRHTTMRKTFRSKYGPQRAGLSRIYPPLHKADVCGVKGKGPLLWLSQHLVQPQTDRIHFFLIADYIEPEDDYVILESIGKGIAIGRLSFYDPDEIEIYRVPYYNASSELRDEVVWAMSNIGRARYDYLLYAQMGVGAIQLMLSGKFPPYDPKQLPYGRNKSYICTEAANYGWKKVHLPIIVPGEVPTPSGFKKAEIDGKIIKIYPN